MVQNSLVKYIREQIRAGYDTGTIKKYLLKYGYSEQRINEAFQYAYPPTAVKHIVHPSKTMIALITAAVCSFLLISAGIFFYLTPKAPSQLLDLRTNLVTSSLSSGEELHFIVELINLGKAKRYDVSLRYAVYNLKDELITFKEETIALETKASSSVSIELGDIQIGSYYLKTTASYNKKTAKARSSFKVTKAIEPKPEIPAKQCPVSCDDNNECTNDYCSKETNYECRHDKIYPCCGNGICEENENYENCLADCILPEEKEKDIFEGKPVWERIELIKEIAKKEREKALQYCKEIEQTGYRYDCFTETAIASNDDNICLNIEDQSYKDSCYKKFAVENKNSNVCAKIIKNSKRDQCYMAFVNKEDYTVCNKIFNKWIKQSCESLKKISEVKLPPNVQAQIESTE